MRPRAHCYPTHVTKPKGHSKRRLLRTVFLDRDGILNEKMPEDQYVTCWEEFHVLPGVPQALRRLNEANLRVIVVSNQRGIARGLCTMADVDAIHTAFQRQLAGAGAHPGAHPDSHLPGAHIDAFFVCPHDKDKCNCRKPLPGLFHQAIAKFPNITPATSVMIGDSLSDIEFGSNLGMQTIFIEGDPKRRSPGAEQAAQLADLRCASLPEAVEILLSGALPEPKAEATRGGSGSL
jgi:D-glycero-D-manno-heptose 1,7-bisphosphate phosphatase